MKAGIKQVTLLFFILFINIIRAQITGSYTIPGSFPTIASAINTLNLAGVAGSVTINIAAGYTETASANGYSLYTIAGASSTSQVIFQKTGVGANPLIVGYSGGIGTASSTVQDAIWRFIGTDFVTIDGIDLLDPNTVPPATMEQGFSFCRASVADGCQYNTIKNCVITLNNQNIGNNLNGNLPSGSRGIDAMNASPSNYTMNIVPTASSGCTSYNKFYNNIIQNCFVGISLTGYNHSSAPYLFADWSNDIGGLSSATSNTIINFTGISVRTWGQHDLNVSYNQVNNIAGGGSPSAGVRGLLVNTATDGSSIINNNTLTIVPTIPFAGSTGFIDCYAGGAFAPTNTITINNNLLLNCVMTANPSGNTKYCIQQINNCKDISISNNKLQNLTSYTTGGDLDFISNQSYSRGRIRIDSNDISVTIASTVTNVGDILGIYNNGGTATSTISISNNSFSNFLINNITSTGDVTWIENNTTSGLLDISGNTWNNLSINQSGQHIFILNQSGSSPLLSITNNSIITGYAHTASSGYMNLCISSAAGSTATSVHRISGNNFSNITSTIPGIGSFNGFYISSVINTPLPLKEVYNNVISNINYNTTGATTLLRFDYSGSGNTSSISAVYNNTISSITTAGELNGLVIAGSSNTLLPINVYKNQVINLSTSGSTYSICAANLLGYSPINFYKNKIGSIISTGTGGKAYGVYMANAVNTVIYNNAIGGVATPSASGADMANGIYIYGGTFVKLYNNTVYLTGTSSGSNFGSNAVYTATTPAIEMLNNIFVNTYTPTGTGFTCVYKRATPNFTTYSLASNYNLFYAGTPGLNRLIYYDGTTTYTSLPLYKNYSFNREYFSVTELPPFTSTVATNLNYLNLNPGIPTQAESSALPLSLVPDDIIGTARNSTNPDMGAWEGNYTAADLLAPVILSSAFTSPICNLTSRTFTANFVDLSGVASGSLSPRVYYKINNGPYSSVQGSLTSGNALNGVWTFSLTYTVNSYDVVYYYVVAQDIATTPNIMSAPSVSFAATDVNTIITPPTPQSSFIIGSVLSGTYTVGSSGNYTTLTAAANAYNLSCLAGPVTFVLLNSLYASGETFPITFLNNANASATNSLLIIPNGAASSIIQGSGSAGAVIKFKDARYITINGVNAAGSSISIVNTNSLASSCVWVASTYSVGPGNKNITVKNLTLKGASTTNTTNFGIYIGMDAVTPQRFAGVDNDNITIQSNTIVTANTGIYASGTSPTSIGGMDAPIISNNVIGPAASTNTTVMPAGSGIIINNAIAPVISGNNVRNIFSSFVVDVRGIDMSYISNAAVSQNTIQNLFASFSSLIATPLVYGMLLGTDVITSTISANDIHSIYNSDPFGDGIRGLMINTANTNSQDYIYNNMISDVFNIPNYPIYTWPAGVEISGSSGNIDFAFNSVAMTGSYNSIPLQGHGSTAFFHNTYGANILIRNNIFSNKIINNAGDPQYGVIMGSFTSTNSLAMDYNDYSVLPGSPLACGSTSLFSIPAIQSDIGSNAHSVSLTPVFNSNTDLHIAISAANINFDNLGAPLTEVPNDIDQQTRNLTVPDIGADEFTIPVCSTANAGTINLATLQACPGHTLNIPSAGASNGVNASYQWQAATTPGGPYLNVIGGSGATTTTYTSPVLPTGTYYYILKGACASSTAISVSNEVTVTISPTPTIIPNNGNICLGQTFTLNPSGADTYTFSSGTAIVSPTNTTTFTVSGTSTQGCAALPVTLNVTVNPIPTLIVNSGAICPGQSYTITPSGANTYTYSSGSAIVSPTATSIYTVTGTNSAGCASTMAVTSTVVVNVIPIISVNSGTVCSGQQFVLTPSGANTYTFSGGSNIVSPSITSSYSVNGTSILGCTSTIQAIANITVMALPLINILTSNGVICAGENVTLTANGALTYTWSTGANNSSIILAPTTNTTYFVTGSNALCQTTASINQQVNPLPILLVTPNPATVCIGDNIEFIASGALSYTWQPQSSNSSSLNLVASVSSVYTLTGLDANNCLNTYTFQFVAEQCTGLYERTTENDFFNIYPNPSKNQLYIQTGDLKENLQIEIYNDLGQLLFLTQLENKLSTIDLSKYTSGIYFVRLLENNLTIKEQKIIKD